MGKYKILVVDDEESLCEILKFNLELEDTKWMWLTAPSKRWRCIPNVIRCCCST